MLFHLRMDSRIWQGITGGMIAWCIILAISTSAHLFSTCSPLAAMWDFTIRDPKCMPFDKISQGILAIASIAVITDLILALLPLSFVFRLQRSVRERIVVAVVMGLGLTASAASLCKIVAVSSKKLTMDGSVDGVDVTFWGMLETQLAYVLPPIPPR